MPPFSPPLLGSRRSTVADERAEEFRVRYRVGNLWTTAPRRGQLWSEATAEDVARQYRNLGHQAVVERRVVSPWGAI